VRENFGLIIESLVAVLLVLTISFCMVLNRRLKKLKADEHALKATISELITATEIAERAIAGLKLTVRDCDQDLGERLHAGESLSRELARQHKNTEELLSRLAQISLAARPQQAAPPQPVPRPAETAQAAPDARATAAAANAFAARARARTAA
jgi:chromosome segregation ATPase